MARPTPAVAIALVPLLGACTGVNPPKFRALGVHPGEPSPEGVVLTFELEAKNDNGEPMPLRTAAYTLSVDGRAVFEGRRSPEATIPAFGTQRFELPAVIPYELGIPTGSAPYAITGTVSYLEPGRLQEILFDSGARVPEAPLSVGGTIDFGDR